LAYGSISACPAPLIPAEYPPSELDPTLSKAGSEKDPGDDVAAPVRGKLPHRASKSTAEAGATNEEVDAKGGVDDDTGAEFDGNGW